MPAPTRPLRIFHGPFNTAGIPGVLAREERRAGAQSTSVCFPQGVYQRDVDEIISDFSADFAASMFRRFDVFNFHFGYSLFGDTLADLPWLRRAGKRIVLHFHGCDIRDSKVVQEKHPINACQACFPHACNFNRTEARRAAARLAHVCVVYTPDLMEFVPGAIWLPQPIDISAIPPAPTHPLRVETPLRIMHAPSSTDLKGTAHLVAAVDRLRSQGAPIELSLVTGRPHSEVIREIAAADIVVDQLLIGAYGLFAIEAMAQSKPTICYLRDDLAPHYPSNIPILQATPFSIEEVLTSCLRQRDTLPEIGRRSRAYVELYHDSRVVSQQLMAAYGRSWTKKPTKGIE